MNTCDYYSKLSEIPFFNVHPNLIPFVGEDYEQYRILQIGESHYLNQQQDNMKHHIEDFIVDWWEKPCNELLSESDGWVDTRNVANNFIDDKDGSYTIFSNVLRSFCKVVLEENDPHIDRDAKKKYSYFAFMNFFQMPSLINGKKYWYSLKADNKSMANEMWDICVQKSSQVVDATIDVLNPRMVVFTSLSAWGAYCGKYKANDKLCDERVVYTAHPQAPYTWCKHLKSLEGKTGQEKFENELKRIYKQADLNGSCPTNGTSCSP